MNTIRYNLGMALFAVVMSLSLVACGDDSSSASNDDAPISSSEIEEIPSSSSVAEKVEMECNVENEGVYKTVKDTLTVYDDGNVMVSSRYFHCESGEWVETECRDPQDACTGDNEGEDRDVICFAQPGNPKAPTTQWTFMCRNNKWEKLSDEEKRQLDAEKKMAEVEIICNDQTKPETKLGDTCSIVTNNTTNVRFGITGPSILTCYVYTEEGWVAKGSGLSSEYSCEEDESASSDSTTPADSVTAPVDTAAAE